MTATSYNVLIVGVGGQGIILASDLLSNLGLKLGLDVKKSEIHGMSQRGGSVESHVRLGPKVLSPLIPKGEADFILAMEEVESLRHLDYPRPDATILASTFRVIPPSVTCGDEAYPSRDDIEAELNRNFKKVALIDVPAIMKKIGNSRTANIILLGAMSSFMPYPNETWKEVLKESLPAKILEINLLAFDEGRTVGKELQKGWS